MASATRTFRVFVSSTFSDLKAERNALQQHVFPQLRKLCAEHGARFQAIDLRWGVRDEAALDQRTMQICLDEIARSRRASPRPNFLVLLGDRYGWRPLPAEIPAAEFEAILEKTASPSDRDLLTRWYHKDENNVPPHYWLQPRQVEGDAQAEAASWAQTEEALRGILRASVSETPLELEQQLKYTASATEQEIVLGAFGVDDAQEHVFCFFRRIAGLPEDYRAAAYRDIDADGRVDADAAVKLSTLKEALRRVLVRNCFDYDARWLGVDASTDHIQQFCADVYASLSAVIRGELARLEEVSDLQREIAAHASFARDRARDFIGRGEILGAIETYLRGADRHPLAVIGASGSGKSAVMARAALLARAMVGNATVISRFIGATPASSDVRALLESLSREIAAAYGDASAVPTDYKELAQEWPRRLALASAGRPLVLFLDALDQLSDADRGRSLAWLPSSLPEHVHLVVSAMTGECEQALRRRLPAGALATLEPMPAAEGRTLLDVWLRNAGRALTPAQQRTVLERFAESGGSPLYLKLAFEEARRWRSSSGDGALRPGIPGVIHDLLARLSADHGAVLVSRGLAYLVAAKHGLSEDEVIDLLSLDTNVFHDFIARAHHTPPEPRLPVVVWSRLYFDLEPYLAERAADGTTLLGFYHRQLREVVSAAYLGGEVRRERHEVLARYFAGQPLLDPQTAVPNLRKLSELPFQQTNAEEWDALHATLTDFDFLEAKCTHVAVTRQSTGAGTRTVYGGVYELQEDYRYALERVPRSDG